MDTNRRIDPRKQFSKWLARYGAIAWGVFLVLTVALMFYRPEVAMPCVWLVLIVTVNKALDTVAYTRNSTTEKILLAGIERTKVEIGLKGIATTPSGGSKDEPPDEESNDEDGGGNG